MITIDYKSIKKIAFAILGLPFICFAIGWLKWYWACLATITIIVCMICGAFYERLKEEALDDNKEISVSISIKVILLVLFIICIWVWQSGIGGFWAQSKDFRYRNAIFRDLVVREWPVIYPKTGYALVYYIGYWLVPAVIGKISIALGVEEITAFNIANTALSVWTVIVLMVIFLLIIYTLKLHDSKQQLFVVLLFIFFSGADIIGNIGYTPKAIEYHLEWWARDYQFSSFTTCLFWVFNQAVPAWLCFLCLLNEKSMKNYVFIGMMCLFNAPLPFIGWMVFCIFSAIKRLTEIHQSENENNKKRIYISEIFSLSNIMTAVFVFPIIGSYLISNYAIHGSGAIRTMQAEVVSESVTVSNVTTFSDNAVVNYFSFVCIEFALLMIFMAWKYRKNVIYYVTLISLLIIPLLKIGAKRDFAMRASIPALIMVFLLAAKFLIEEKAVLKLKGSIKRMTYILLIVFLLLGACTPVMEFYRGIHETVLYGIKNEKYDNIYTLGGDGPYDDIKQKKIYGNFMAVDIEKQLFFKVFSKSAER